MDDIPFGTVISISQLLVDIENPRFAKNPTSQRDAIRAMVASQPEKIMSLAQHLVENGSNPASIPIVMPSTQGQMYYVLDGNRRISAIKILETPSLVDGVLHLASEKKLKELSSKFANNPITKLNCIVFTDRAQADLWIQLTHRGQNDGAGVVPWDGQVSARYDERKKGRKSISLQVIDFVKDHGELDNISQNKIENGKFPVTNLDRLLNTPYVRKKLGIEIKNGELLISYPHQEVLKGLSQTVNDLGTRKITVSDIKRQSQRIDYINTFDNDELPDPSKEFNFPQPIEIPDTESKEKTSKQKTKRTTKDRNTLIPKECNLDISGNNISRIKKIYIELKKLALDEFPNASAVLLRVFIEISLDHFLSKQPDWTYQKVSNSTLAQKLTWVANYFEKNGIMSKEQLALIHKAASGETILAASIRNFHGFVHNRFYSPVPKELTVAWDDLQMFIEKIWES